MICEWCEERGKTWNGADPRCYWEHGPSNWNCGGLNLLRDLVEEDSPYGRARPLPLGVRTSFLIVDEQRYAVIGLPEQSGAIYLGWYKNRGKTEQALFIHEYEGPRSLTQQDVAWAQQFLTTSPPSA